MEPVPPHYTKLDVTLGPAPSYESLEAGDSLDEEAAKTKVQKYSAILIHVAFCSATQGQDVLGPAGGMAPIKEESIGEDGEGEEVTLTINVARQRIKLKARSVWDLEEHKFGKSTLCRAFTW